MVSKNNSKRALYVFEFPDNSAYIGLTHNYDRRYNQHMRDSVRIIKKTDEIGHEFIMYNDWMAPAKAAKEEVKLIQQYKDDGWKVLNRTRGGELGSNIIKWTEEEILKYAKSCKDYREFTLKLPSVWNSAKRQGLIDKVSKILDKARNGGYWDKEKALEEARRHKTKSSFHAKSGGAWSYAKKNGFLEECQDHMVEPDRTRKWTHDKIMTELVKYKSISEMRSHQQGLYSILHRMENGDQYLGYYEKLIKPNGYWSEERMREIASTYKYKKDLRKDYPVIRYAASKMGIWDDICSHMERPPS